MDQTHIELLKDDGLPEAVRVALVQNLQTREDAHATRALELDKLRSERRRLFWNTPFVAALAGLITLSATFFFERLTARDATENTITLEEVRQELSESSTRLLQQLEQEQIETEAQIAAQAREREFQYEIVKAELTDADKTNAERAAVLLFLVRAGILPSLNREELEAMARDQIENPGDDIIPRLTGLQALPGADDARPVDAFDRKHAASMLGEPVGLLSFSKEGRPVSVCTAFLTAPDQILTASHCLSGFATGNFDSAFFELMPGTRGASGRGVRCLVWAGPAASPKARPLWR